MDLEILFCMSAARIPLARSELIKNYSSASGPSEGSARDKN
jgi:hypothetical protein